MSRSAFANLVQPTFIPASATKVVSNIGAWSRAVPIALAVVASAIALSTWGNWSILSPDSFTYLTAARSIYDTGGLPAERLIAPPGFPMFLAPLSALGEMPLGAFRIAAAACFAATVVLTWKLFQIELGKYGAPVAALLVATSGPMINQSATLQSEIAFTPIALACLLLAARWRTHKPVSHWEAIFGGLLAAIATFVRSAGIVLAPIMFLACLTNRGSTRQAKLVATMLVVAGFVIPQAAWSFRQNSYPAGYSYGTIWTTPREIEQTDATGIELQARRLAVFGPQRLADLTQAIVPNHLGWRFISGPHASTARWIIGGGLIVAALVRLVRLRSPIDLFFLLTMGMLALWPWNEGVRLVTPLIPILCGYACWLFLGVLKRASNQRPLTIACAAIGTVCLAGQLIELPYTHAALNRRAPRAIARVDQMEQLANWQREHLPNDARVLSVTRPGDNAKLVLIGACYLSRRPVNEFIESDADTIPQTLPGNGPAYAFVDDGAVDRPLPDGAAEIGCPGTFRVIQLR